MTDKSKIPENREFVVPGDIIIKSMNYLPGKNCFREGDSIFTKKIGVVDINNRVISVIPLNSTYVPKIGDMVIGEVEEVQSSGWIIDIKSIYKAYLPLSGIRGFVDTAKTDLSKLFDIGDCIYTKITRANEDAVHVSMVDVKAKKLKTGRIVKTNPSKIPRIIGKQGSMINLIKTKTGCKINVGQNGYIWIEGGKEDLFLKVIDLIEKKSQLNGLTDNISKILEKGK